MELAEAYPAFSLSDFLSVHLPDPGREAEFADGVRESLRALASLSDDDMTEGYVPYPAAGGLIPWGDSAEGDTFYWHTVAEDPDAWTVVVETTNGYWATYDGTLTDYLTGLAAGAVEPDGLPSEFPGDNPSVEL
ncbi:hypothetical protein [Streptomyces sp. NPDC093795]|uniref:hypothetical protein n=1 Tax=Streptomyces sp. NPDC093795 TaxID=3366051 RepID=UPI00382A3F77